MSLILNWFPVEVIPKSLDLPTRNFKTFEESTTYAQAELSEYSYYRPRQHDGSGVMLILLNGPSPPTGTEWLVRTYSVDSSTDLFAKLIRDSLHTHFRNQSAFVASDRFGISCHWPAESFPDLRLRLLTGLRLRTFRTSMSEPIGVIANWDVRTEFTETLRDDFLRGSCLGLSVLLKSEASDISVPPNLRPFRNRFIGHVEAATPEQVSIKAKDGMTYNLQPRLLRLETSPGNLRALEQRTGKRFPIRRVQQHSKSLTSDGRRNNAVLLHRMEAIRKALSPLATDSVVMRMNVYGEGKVVLDTTPITLAQG